MRQYTPRRANKRWLDGDCPRGVLAIFDHPDSTDRYTVFYAEPIRVDGEVWIWYRGMSADPFSAKGISIAAEMRAHEAARFRYRVKHRAAKWSNLPEDVQAIVRRDLEEMETWPDD